jgi:hypothetical protein
MKRVLLKILPFVLTSLLVVVFWKIWTGTDNYAWHPQGKELLFLDIALTSIFFYKTIFWLFVANLAVLTVIQLKRKKYKIAGITLLLTIVFYIFAGQYVSKKCAPFYHRVFLCQSIPEGLITRPILEAGYYIGPILTDEISNKEMKYRLYAIGGLKKIKYKPATGTLKLILLDKTENEIFRANAYETLHSFNTDETRRILNNFRSQATDTLDKKVIELGDYFIKNK